MMDYTPAIGSGLGYAGYDPQIQDDPNDTQPPNWLEVSEESQAPQQPGLSYCGGDGDDAEIATLGRELAQ